MYNNFCQLKKLVNGSDTANDIHNMGPYKTTKKLIAKIVVLCVRNHVEEPKRQLRKIM